MSKAHERVSGCGETNAPHASDGHTLVIATSERLAELVLLPGRHTPFPWREEKDQEWGLETQHVWCPARTTKVMTIQRMIFTLVGHWGGRGKGGAAYASQSNSVSRSIICRFSIEDKECMPGNIAVVYVCMCCQIMSK